MTWRDALVNPFMFESSCGGVESRHAVVLPRAGAGRHPQDDSVMTEIWNREAGVAPGPHDRFELDEQAFMDAIDLIPLFLQKSDSELRELVRNDH